MTPIPPHVGKGWTAKELKANRSPKTWVVQEMAVEGRIVMLAADKGGGKTTLLCGLANAIQSGSHFMGELETKQRKVLFWQADECQAQAEERLDVIAVDDDVQFVFGDDPHWEKFSLERLEERRQAAPFQVLILDSVTSLMAGGEHRMNDNEFAQQLYALEHWAGANKITVFLACHLCKPDRTKTTQTISHHDVIGNGLQTAAIDDIWGLWKPKNASWPHHYVLECLGKRNCRTGTIWNLRGDDETWDFQLESVGDGDLKPQQQRQLKDKVLQLLRQSSEWLSLESIAKATQANAEHIRRICRELFSQRLIERRELPSTGGRRRLVYGVRK